jgi:bifunctional non-homologous end joining protein LigD
MLAKAAEADALGLPGMAWEVKYDGYRLVAECDGGATRLQARSGRDVTAEFPTVASALRQSGWRGVLDGEVVVLEGGGASFNALQNRGSMSRADLGRQMRLVAFDALDAGGADLRRLPYESRRLFLDAAVAAVASPTVLASPFTLDGAALWRSVKAAGWEGVVGKPLRSAYLEGRRGPWVKVKVKSLGEFVVVGWTDGEGARASDFGALVLAERGADGALSLAGKVGTGFDQRSLEEVRRALDLAAPRACALSDAEAARVGRDAHWIEPAWVATVEFAERTEGGILRFPSFKRMEAR